MKYIILTLGLTFSISIFAQERTCHALFDQVRPTEEQIDIAIGELHGLRHQMYLAQGSDYIIYKKLFDQKILEMSKVLSASEIKARLRKVKTVRVKPETLIDIKRSAEVLHQAIAIEKAKDYLKVIRYPEATTIKNQTTSLILAAENGVDPLIAEGLILLGAKVNYQGQSGATSLHQAVNREQNEIAAILLKYGANPNLQASTGNTPLILARLVYNARGIKLLLDNNADPTIKNKSGQTVSYDLKETIEHPNVHKDVRRKARLIIKILKMYGVVE